jgi:hypothetical protein
VSGYRMMAADYALEDFLSRCTPKRVGRDLRVGMSWREQMLLKFLVAKAAEEGRADVAGG